MSALTRYCFIIHLYDNDRRKSLETGGVIEAKVCHSDNCRPEHCIGPMRKKGITSCHIRPKYSDGIMTRPSQSEKGV